MIFCFVITGLCNHQDAVHITAILGESVVFNCHVEFPDQHPVPYVLQWEKKVGDTVRFRGANQQSKAPTSSSSLLSVRELKPSTRAAKEPADDARDEPGEDDRGAGNAIATLRGSPGSTPLAKAALLLPDNSPAAQLLPERVKSKLSIHRHPDVDTNFLVRPLRSLPLLMLRFLCIFLNYFSISGNLYCLFSFLVFQFLI